MEVVLCGGISVRGSEVLRDVSLAGFVAEQCSTPTPLDSQSLNQRPYIFPPPNYCHFSDTCTEMEAAGIALAVLPLLLNQLDNYVQGIETFRLFGAKRYRRELEWYRSNLASQQTILQNTLMHLLDGVDEYGDGVDDLIRNPLGIMLQREDLRARLREKLGGTSFDPFCQTMNEFSILLNDLYRKLGWEMGMSAVVSVLYNRRSASGLWLNISSFLESPKE
jgi:hypothetical protein